MSNNLNILIEELSKLPSVGPKSAQRIAYYILKEKEEKIFKLTNAITQAKQKIRYCSVCSSFSEEELCGICSNKQRDSSTICVVQESSDVLTIEKTGQYKGLYHVLHGVISPVDGIGVNDINLISLINRCKNDIKEVIIATNPTTQGEGTALYIGNILKPAGICVTRLAYGLPVGGNLEFADDITIRKSLEGRLKI